MKDMIAAKEMRNLMALDFFKKWWKKIAEEKQQKVIAALDDGISEGILAHLQEREEE